MLYYRLYFMHRFSGLIVAGFELAIMIDEAALAIAQGWSEGAPMELWNLHRKLKRWDEVPLIDG